MEWKYSMKPFTKWVGGKRQLLPQILGILPDIFNLTARNSPTSKVAGCKGFGLVQGLAPCA